MQNILLGLCNDVYSAVFCEENLSVDAFGARTDPDDQMGDYSVQASGAFQREYERSPALRKLYGKALRTQKAACAAAGEITCGKKLKNYVDKGVVL